MNPEADKDLAEGHTQHAPKQASRLPLSAHLACGWPLLLVTFGGAVGGGLGGLAYVANIAIYKSSLPIAAKTFLNVSIGAAAFGVWLIIGILIHATWS